jgi:4-amino-4-deoxy-L-arabinose transferase-like glycosyltransferase
MTPVSADRAPFPARWPPRLRSAPGLLALLALWLVCTAWLRPLLLPDEGRYAGVAREMLHGDWAVPLLDGLPFFHKPPLMYWIDIVAMHAFGVTAFAARAGSIVGAWLMGATLYFAMRRWHDARSAALALGVLATCPFFFLGAQYANHDMLVAGLIGVAVLAFVRAADRPPAVDLRWCVAGWVACALALLSKGLIGIVLPALVVGPWLLAQRRWRQVLGLLHPLGLLAFLLVGAPWFIAMQLRYPGFYDYFFVEQHFRRFAESGFNNVQPVWFLFAVLPLLSLPASAWMPVALRRAWARRDRHDDLYVWWVLAIVAFFSLPSSKLVGYVLPAVAPWCALIARGLADHAAGLRQARWLMAGSGLLCVGLVIALAWVAPHSDRAAAKVLAQRLAPGDRVAMVDEYLYDVPFYARLREPVLIASDWADPELPKHDNWRKELFDAGRFDPALAERVRWPIARLDELSCGHAVWFVVSPGKASRVQRVPGIEKVYADANTELWRAAARACG